MTSSINKVLFFLLLPFISLFGQEIIFQTEHLSDVLKYTDKNTLVLIDLDNTIIRPKQILGSDEWFGYSLKKHEEEGHSKEAAREKVVEHWMEIQMKTEMQLLTEDTGAMLEEVFKSPSFGVVAITKRPPRLAHRTLEQLKALHVNFAKGSNLKDRFFSGNQLLEGIIFIAEETDKNKGTALQEFLSATQIRPRKILLIDDKESHIESVAQVLKKMPIEFIGLHYTKANELIAKFNPAIADLQLKKLMSILSDEEALHLLQKAQ